MENALTGLNSMSLAALTRPTEERGLGWSREEVEVLNAGVRREMMNTGVHAYLPMYAALPTHKGPKLMSSLTSYMVYAQKP